MEVTASHNPPRDNGYKVYLGDGSQIVPPADADIAAEIAAIASLNDVPRPDTGWQTLDDAVLNAYLARTDAVLAENSPAPPAPSTPRCTAWARTRFSPRSTAPVSPPRNSSPNRPTPTPISRPSPSPTRKSPARWTWPSQKARETDPDLIIANDPDADRCAVAVKRDDAWRMLRGDEVGALLAAHLVTRGARGTFAESIVSSSLLGRIAEKAGLPYEETLTGFKWIARVEGLRYGYEEALGYCVDPEGVRDKDGITAALLITELASELKEQNRTLLDLLDDLAVDHGLHATDQLAVRVEDLSVIARAMEQLREHPPTELAGLAITRAEDLTQGTDRLPPTDGLRYTLDGARVVVRPSGTEPKLKCYLEVVVPVATHADLPAAHSKATDLLTAIKRDLSAAAGI